MSIVAIAAILLCVSCGSTASTSKPSTSTASKATTSVSAATGEGAILFTDDTKHEVTVSIDGKEYKVQTLEAASYKPGMKLQEAAANSIKVKAGSHSVIVKSGGKELLNKTITVNSSALSAIGL